MSGPATDRVAIVTGASRGIGRATVIRLATDFAATAIVARDAATLPRDLRDKAALSRIPLFDGFPVPIPDCRRVFGNGNWQVLEMAGRGGHVGSVLTAHRVARQYPSADLTMVPLAIMAARRS